MSSRERVDRMTDQALRVTANRRDARRRARVLVAGAQTDEALWRQAAEAAAYPGMIGLYLMPDTHLGYGIPVGGVAVTENVIIQAGSGYDISCGVVHLRARGLSAADVADEDQRRRFVRAVEARVTTGVGSHRPKHMPRFDERDVEEIFRYGASRSASRPRSASGSTLRSTTPRSTPTASSERARRRARSSAPSAAAITSSRCKSTATTAPCGS